MRPVLPPTAASTPRSRDGADGLAVRVGPLEPEGAARLRRAVEIPEAGSVFERLADDVETEAGEAEGEFVVVRLRPS